MSLTIDDLYGLLPAVHRVEDERRGRPLKAFLSLFAEQIAVLEEDLAQLHDDQFIETCAEWVVPYLGDLIGARLVHDLAQAELPETIRRALSARAQVANAIALRRRKGTLAALEQAARDVTGWPTRAVEYFERLAVTPHVKHRRAAAGFFADLRNGDKLDQANTAFDTLPRSVEMRRIACGRGRHNIPNIGVHFFRLRAFEISRAQAFRAGPRRYTFDPLGRDIPLFNRSETESDVEHLTLRSNVPLPISRRMLHRRREEYYGPGRSVRLFVRGEEVPAEKTRTCDLSDWSRRPQDHYGIDPELGRVALPANESDTRRVQVSYSYGFSAAIGAGPFPRAQTQAAAVRSVGASMEHTTVQEALVTPPVSVVVEIRDHGIYEETVVLEAKGRLELRAGDGKRPVLHSPAPWTVRGTGESDVVIEGLTVAGATITVGQGVRSLVLRQCTLVPSDDHPSLMIKDSTRVRIERSIMGPIEASPESKIELASSFIDATTPERMAITATADGYAGPLDVDRCTLIGGVRTRRLDASNSIFLANMEEVSVQAEQRQEGCARYCWLPPGARTPKQFRCVPTSPASPIPQPLFTSLDLRSPAYGQLSAWCPPEIRAGADDGAEMGAFHDLYQPQRESNAWTRIGEMTRFGSECGVLYET